jgi:hypothetical protein
MNPKYVFWGLLCRIQLDLGLTWFKGLKILREICERKIGSRYEGGERVRGLRGRCRKNGVKEMQGKERRDG